MQNDNLYKKLRCIFLVLAIISMIIALTKKVHALEMTESIIYYYDNNIGNCSNIEWFYNSTGISEENYKNNFGYIYISEFNNYLIVYISKYQTSMPCLDCSTSNLTIDFTTSYDSWVRGRSLSITNNISSGTTVGYELFIDKTSNTIQRYFSMKWNSSDRYQYNVNLYDTNGNTTHSYWVDSENNVYNYIKYNNMAITENINAIALSTVKANFDFACIKPVTTNNMYALKVENISDFTEYLPPAENTNGFSVFKYNNLGIDTLRIVPPKNKVQVGTHKSNNSTVAFDLNIDGSTIPTTFNSNSEYYFESMEYNIAYYEIPFSAFLPSSINDFTNVYVTNVVYTNEWGNQGGETGTDTFYYVDKVYLKQTIENEDIGQVTIAHVDSQTGYDETHITDIYNMITNASTISGDFDTEKNLVGGSTTPYNFTSFQDAVIKTIECYHPTGTKDTDWTPIISENNISFASGDNMYWLEYVNRNDVVFNNRYNYNISPYTYIRENNYTGYYDILYFIVHEQIYTSNGTGFSKLSNSYTRYYYFISDRYYNKLILYREMDIMEYIELNNKISEKIYNYLYDRLLNIDDNIYYYIKDKANIDNDILTALENIDNDMQFNFDIINDILNRILNALSDLNLSQLDTIETKLNTIISNIGLSNTQNEDDTVAEAIQYYKSHNTNGVPTTQVYIDDKMSIWISGKVHLWLQGTDANTDKTNLINSVFDTLTSIYDSMKNNNDIFPNIQYYLDAIAKNNNYGYETHGDYMTRLFKGNVDISTYNGISE